MDILVINRKDTKFYYTIYEYCRNTEGINKNNAFYIIQQKTTAHLSD